MRNTSSSSFRHRRESKTNSKLDSRLRRNNVSREAESHA